MSAIFDLVTLAKQWLFETLVQPVMVLLGLQNYLPEGFRALDWFLIGALQLLVMVTFMRGLERWRPAQDVLDRHAVRVDMVYTVIHRLGLVRLALFFTLTPLWYLLFGQLSMMGYLAPDLDALWPGVTDLALVSFLLYLVVFDFVDYWYHRASHHFNWWWSLHALHHSQREMTYWTDNRNHLADDVLRDSVFVLLALVVGVPPAQFVALVALTQLVESLSHANVRLDFGPFKRWLVSPHFHRVHHAVGVGHESSGAGTLGGVNFAVLFPVWDILFGTASWDRTVHATGIRDQLEGRDYGRGFWSQQWLGLKRLAGRA